MRFSKRVGLVAGAAALTFAGVGIAESNGANDQDLRARMAQMEAELAQLKAQQGEKWLTEQRAAEIRSIVQDVLQDADTRASLLQGGATAGYDNGFFLTDTGGAFRLNVNGQIQARWLLNIQDDDASAPATDSTRWGFELARTKLMFSGHVVDPSWTYHIEANFLQVDSGDFNLEDAYITKGFDNGWNLTVGQFKLPFSREELVHSSKQLAIERSLVGETFSTDRSQGVMIGWNNDQFSVAGAVSDGARQLNGPALGYDTEYAFSARAQILFGGTWEQFEDFTSPSTDTETAILVGGGLHYETMEYGTSGAFGGVDDEISQLILTGDISVEFGGANVFAALYYADVDDDASGPASIDGSPWGFVLQGGIYLNDQWELYARFEYGDSDDVFTVDSEELTILSGGVNYYISGHQLKWSADIGYAFDQVDSFWAGPFSGVGTGFASNSELTGFREDTSVDQDGQFVIRTQLQLLF